MTGRPDRVAAIQMTSGPDVEENLGRAGELLDEAAAEGARLAVLPENFACMPLAEEARLTVAEDPGAGTIQDWLSESARATGLWIVGGTIPLRISGDRVRATASCLVYTDRGELAARYDKIHLFDVRVDEGARAASYKESKHTWAGEKAVVVDTPLGRMGLAVCYDLRFPELFRRLLDMGMEFAVLPSAFTATTGKAHWEPLLRARAIENLAWMIAAAQDGRHPNGRDTHGDSMVVDPWGTIVTRRVEGVGIVVASIDRERQAALRKDFPSLEHRTQFLNRDNAG